MDSPLNTILSSEWLTVQAIKGFSSNGFLTIPGPLSGPGLDRLAKAYDDLMDAASGPDFKIASTTTRMSDLLSFDVFFERVFVYPPLLKVCSHFFREPFKLSSFLARTLRGGSCAQELHSDLPRGSEDAPLLGFILMIDPFRQENGATRFVPGSHLWHDVPGDRNLDPRAEFPGEIIGCGEAGGMIVFDASIWHGHTANLSSGARRSIQGYFVRRRVRAGFDFRNRLPEPVQRRLTSLSRYLLAVDE